MQTCFRLTSAWDNISCSLYSYPYCLYIILRMSLVQRCLSSVLKAIVISCVSLDMLHNYSVLGISFFNK
jgi:hypothetical protein